MTLVALAATLFSFTKFGGEGFEIFLNNKSVIRQYGKTINDVKSLRLNQHSADGQLTVLYHHCGQVGRNRVITIRDGQKNVLKEWRFADAAASVASPMAMNCSVKDILSLVTENNGLLKLFYSSSELPNGRLLTNLIVENNPVAGNK